MVGNARQNDKNFTPENYEGFYEHHYFEPLSEEAAFNAHELIPRFGWAFDKVEEIKPKNLLDLGCLDGSFALTIAKHFGIPVTGIDLTQDGIDIARERAEALTTPAIFHQGTVEDWLQHFIDNGIKFECITFFEIIEHVKDVQHCLRLIDQVLAPGGHVLVSTPEFESPTYGMDDEENTCHIRLYTMKDESYFAVNKHGTKRWATSITKEIGKERIKEMGVYSELINVHYQ